jgi:hypothetical protein
MDEYPNLQKRKDGTAANHQSWNIENIRDGLEYFSELNGHYPNCSEFNHFDYLPSTKTAERKFGGMVQLRKTLSLSGPMHFGSGESRSQTAIQGDARAKQYEKDFFDFLTSKIPEVRVHEHKIIRPSGLCCDFFIYTEDTWGIVLDLFYAKDIRSAMINVNLKLKKYCAVQFPVFLIIVGNNHITQSEIESLCNKRKSIIPEQIQVLTEATFKSNLETYLKC